MVKRIPGIGRYVSALLDPAASDPRKSATPQDPELAIEQAKPRKAVALEIMGAGGQIHKKGIGYNSTKYVDARNHRRNEEAELLRTNDSRLDKATMLLDRDIEYEVHRSAKLPHQPQAPLKGAVALREVERAGPKFTQIKRSDLNGSALRPAVCYEPFGSTAGGFLASDIMIPPPSEVTPEPPSVHLLQPLPQLAGAPTSTQLGLLTTDLLEESKKHGAAKRALAHYKHGVKTEKGGTEYGERLRAFAVLFSRHVEQLRVTGDYHVFVGALGLYADDLRHDSAGSFTVAPDEFRAIVLKAAHRYADGEEDLSMQRRDISRASMTRPGMGAQAILGLTGVAGSGSLPGTLELEDDDDDDDGR